MLSRRSIIGASVLSSRLTRSHDRIQPMSTTRDAGAYWKANVRLLRRLLVVWFLASYGLGILFVDVLNRVRIPGTGFPLGFWFAQQGSIYVFIFLVLIYALRMRQLDRKHGVE